MGEQVVALEHDADVAPQGVEVDPGAGDRVALDPDRAALDLLQRVHAAQQRGLAGAGRADQADHLVPLDVQGDALEHLVVTVGLVDVVDLEERHQEPPARRLVSRSIR